MGQGQTSDIAAPVSSAEEAAAVRSSSALIASLVMATALGPLAMSSFTPGLPSMQVDFAVPSATVQLTLTVSIGVMALCSLFYGLLADRYGRRPVLLAGIALAISGSIVCAAAPSVQVAVAGRGLQAAGTTAGVVLTRVIVRDVYPEARAAAVLAYITVAMTIAPLVGPVLGGYLIDNWGWRSVFVLLGALASLLLLLVSRCVPETRPSRRDGVERRGKLAGGYGSLLRGPDYLVYVVYGAMLQGVFMTFVAGAPHVAADRFGLSASAYGWFFMFAPAGYAVGSLLAGPFARRLPRERLLSAGAVLVVVICAFSAWRSFAPDFSAMWFFAPMGATAAVIGAVLPSTQLLMLSRGGAGRGAASGFFSFVQLSVSAVLAQVVGVLVGFGAGAVSGLMVVVGLLACVAASVQRKYASAPAGGSPE